MNKREARIIALQAAAADLRTAANSEIFDNFAEVVTEADRERCCVALDAIADSLEQQAGRLAASQPPRHKSTGRA